jgi:phosphatidylinositol alpha-1,6-mannosyltransferase
MPKILALVTDAFGGRGGIAQYNRDFLTALAQSGASIAVLPRNAPDRAVAPAGIVQSTPRRGRVAYALTALGMAVRERFDIVICGHLFMAPLASFVARLRGSRMLLQTHGIEAWPRPSDRRRAAAESADLILSVSRYTRARVLAWAMIAPERVLVVPNTVGDTFTPGDGSALRKAWNLEGKFVLLTVGRLDASERYKGQDRVIAAIPDLVAAGHDIAYVVLGEGDDLARLKSLAQVSGVADRVKFVGAPTTEELVAAYRMADLFVMPSTGEGFGIAFLEAMACGTPALGLAVAGTYDALCDGELGMLVCEDDLQAALAAALEGSKSDAQDLAAAVRRRFGLDGFSASTRAVLTRLREAA